METAVLAAQCPMRYATHIVREEKGREVCHRLDYGFRPVRLPDHPEVPLWLVVVRGLGAPPMMLLTNLPMRRNRTVLWWAVSAYLSRWRIEEAIRFVRQSYEAEDIRVLTYDRLRNMAVLVNSAAFFTAVVLGSRIKLDILATHVAQGIQALVRHPRLPPLRTGRWHPRGLRKVPKALNTRRQRPAPAYTRLRLSFFWGESWSRAG